MSIIPAQKILALCNNQSPSILLHQDTLREEFGLTTVWVEKNFSTEDFNLRFARIIVLIKDENNKYNSLVPEAQIDDCFCSIHLNNISSKIIFNNKIYEPDDLGKNQDFKKLLISLSLSALDNHTLQTMIENRELSILL